MSHKTDHFILMLFVFVYILSSAFDLWVLHTDSCLMYLFCPEAYMIPKWAQRQTVPSGGGVLSRFHAATRLVTETMLPIGHRLLPKSGDAISMQLNGVGRILEPAGQRVGAACWQL